MTQVSTQMQINNNDNLSFTYYNLDPEINPTINSEFMVPTLDCPFAKKPAKQKTTTIIFNFILYYNFVKDKKGIVFRKYIRL